MLKTQSVLESTEPQLLFKQTIYGRPVSKSNSQMILLNTKNIPAWFGEIKRCDNSLAMQKIIRRAVSIWRTKSKAAKDYQRDFMYQIKRQLKPITEDCKIVCRIWYARRSSDVDESLILDSLQLAGIIKNDNQIRVKEIYGNVDPNNPRAEIELWSLGVF